jgi:WD40 repeat protein
LEFEHRGATERSLEGHTDAVDPAVFSLDSQLLASGSDDNTIMLWDLNTALAKLVFRGHTDRIFAIAISPHAELLASSSRDGTVRLWDLESGNLE